MIIEIIVFMLTQTWPFLNLWTVKILWVFWIQIKGSVDTVHAMKACGVNGDRVKLILNFGSLWVFGLPHDPITLASGKANSLPID
jgi:hypothetical protein